MSVRNSRPRYQSAFTYAEIDEVTYQLSVSPMATLKGKTRHTFAKQVLNNKFKVNPKLRSMELQADGTVKYKNID